MLVQNQYTCPNVPHGGFRDSTPVTPAAPGRMKAAPDVQTFNEQGIPGLDLTSWVAIVGPAKMSPELVARINAALVQVLNSPEVREFYARGARETSPGSPAALRNSRRTCARLTTAGAR